MRYAVLGGDMRFVHLVSMLRESGRTAAGFLQEEAGCLRELAGYDCIVSGWPMRWPLCREEVDEAAVLENIAPGSVMLLCGPGFPKKRRWDLQYVNLWADERLLRENAWLTAEGAAACAMRRMRRSLAGMKCMVVGCGRIGRALCGVLGNMGAEVTLISGSEAKRQEMRAAGHVCIGHADMPGRLPEQQLIFSTPPARVIGGEEMRHVQKDALLLDLASAPYGIDLEAAQAAGLQAFREPGLPGRYCPLSAARAVCSAILRWEEAEKHDE